MTIIKLLAVLMLSSSVGISSISATPGIKKTQPATYDLKVGWFYNASVGYNQLWAYTSSGGGITQQVYWTQQSTYWASFVQNSFFSAEFNWQIRIYRSTENDALFTLNTPGVYVYNSPDNANISYYSIPTGAVGLRLSANVVDSDYYVAYKNDVNNRDYVYTSGDVYYWFDSVNYIRSIILTTDSVYTYASTYGMPSFVQMRDNAAGGTLINAQQAFYFKLYQTANIEGDDWWDIYNQGVNAGYDAGLDAGYDAGLDAGRLENTAWEDAFTIIKGAIDTVGDVMVIQLFGPITIGTLVSIPLIVGLLFWIIDKWRGS